MTLRTGAWPGLQESGLIDSAADFISSSRRQPVSWPPEKMGDSQEKAVVWFE